MSLTDVVLSFLMAEELPRYALVELPIASSELGRDHRVYAPCSANHPVARPQLLSLTRPLTGLNGCRDEP